MKMRHIHFQQEVREMLDNSQGGWMVPALGLSQHRHQGLGDQSEFE